MAHMLGVAGLLADTDSQLCALAKASPTGGLPSGEVSWLAVAETCGLEALQGLLCSHIAERLGEAAGEERQALLQELLAASGHSVGAEIVARVLTQALDASRRSGPVEVRLHWPGSGCRAVRCETHARRLQAACSSSSQLPPGHTRLATK